MITFTKTKENITMVLDDELITFSSEHPKFKEITELIDGGDDAVLLSYLAPMMGKKRSRIDLHIRMLRAIQSNEN